jgi:hypothetical protein
MAYNCVTLQLELVLAPLSIFQSYCCNGAQYTNFVFINDFCHTFNNYVNIFLFFIF